MTAHLHGLRILSIPKALYWNPGVPVYQALAKRHRRLISDYFEVALAGSRRERVRRKGTVLHRDNSTFFSIIIAIDSLSL